MNHPGGPQTAAARVHQLVQLGRHVEARDLATAELTKVPFDADLHEQLANAHGGLKEWDKALDAIEQALSLTPGDAHRHGFRAMALSLLARHNDAGVAFDHALQLDPENAFTHTAQVEAVLRDPALDTKNDRSELLARARRSSDALLRLFPERDVSHLMHAKLLLEDKKFSEAKATADALTAAALAERLEDVYRQARQIGPGQPR